MNNSPLTNQVASVSQCFRVVGACVFASMLGLVVVDPFRQAVGMNSSCQSDRTPATLVVENQGQVEEACVVAMSAF